MKRAIKVTTEGSSRNCQSIMTTFSMGTLSPVSTLRTSFTKLREREVELANYIYDLLLEDCPEDYKRVIKNEVFKQ